MAWERQYIGNEGTFREKELPESKQEHINEETKLKMIAFCASKWLTKCENIFVWNIHLYLGLLN